ncbi:2'-5' RNA ligase family protein [Chloroflexota bacterium]
MALLVVAYPEIAQYDYDEIQAYRLVHDGLYFGVVEPHFTIVFPVFDWDTEAFVVEVSKQARGIQSFDFTLRSAVLNKDAFNDYYHAFLVPDEGYGQIVRLHDQMFADKLFPQRVLTVDFIPHIGIGNSLDPLACLAMVREWNNQDFAISGRVSAVYIINYMDDTIETIQRIQLNDI